MQITKECFFEGIKYAREGNHLFDISGAIGDYAEEHGYGVVRDLCGHGLEHICMRAPGNSEFQDEPEGNASESRYDISD